MYKLVFYKNGEAVEVNIKAEKNRTVLSIALEVVYNETDGDAVFGIYNGEDLILTEEDLEI